MKTRTFFFYLLPTLIFVAVFTFYPIAYGIWISLSEVDIHTLTTRYIGLGNYVEVLNSEGFRKSLIATLSFGIPSLCIQIPLGFFIALLLNNKIKGRRVFLTLILVPFLIPPITAGLVMKWMFNPTWGMANYFLSVVGVAPVNWLGDPTIVIISIIIANVWQYSPLIALTFFAGLQSLPKDPIEAAMIDGASWWQLIRYVIFPQMKPFVLFVLIIRSMDCLRIFDQVFMMTGGGPGLATEMVSIYNYRLGFRYFRLGESAATDFVYLLILLGLIISYVVFLYKREAEEL